MYAIIHIFFCYYLYIKLCRPNNTFNACSNLSNLTIPKSITSFGDNVFSGTTSLTNLNYNGTMDEWNAITKSTNWLYKASLTTITCTDGVITL